MFIHNLYLNKNIPLIDTLFKWILVKTVIFKPLQGRWELKEKTVYILLCKNLLLNIKFNTD